MQIGESDIWWCLEAAWRINVAALYSKREELA